MSKTIPGVNGNGAAQARAKSSAAHQCGETCCISLHLERLVLMSIEGTGLCLWALGKWIEAFYHSEKTQDCL